jgi:hypothetical protein
MSDKSVFGQCGPKNRSYLYEYFSQQTICRKLWSIYINHTNLNLFISLKFVFIKLVTYIQSTKVIYNVFYSFLIERVSNHFAFYIDGASFGKRMGKELVHSVANGHADGQDVRVGPLGPILDLVKIFVLNNNPQITKARIYLISKFRITYFFELCMLVGISEAIRLLLTYCTNLI